MTPLDEKLDTTEAVIACSILEGAIVCAKGIEEAFWAEAPHLPSSKMNIFKT
jgi:hypothetical protein